MKKTSQKTLKTRIKNQTLQRSGIMSLSPADLRTDLAGDGGTVLHYVSWKGTSAMVKWVLEALGTDAKTLAAMPDNDGWTPPCIS